MKDRLRELIEAAGGRVSEGLFVEEPGVLLLAATALTPEAAQVFAATHIDTARPEYEQLAEFQSRVTYLSFRTEPGSAEAFNRRMVDELGHLSVHAATSATFLIAGVSVETCLELVAHGEALVARLTSSRTKAQDRPLFRVQGDAAARAQQKAAIRAAEASHAEHRAKPADRDGREWLNRLRPGAKAVALTYTMTLKDFHKTFVGRLSHHGVEQEMREVCETMCRLLHTRYPLVVKEPAHYYALSNAAKYEGEAQPEGEG